ncbi:hypothetical protein RRG08_004207 [Elysia crispata]|uniref:Uncharacterized protein n=1 Tax=Elysia crispata TaxID=231223 RepID=A0AAE1D909_9GAST|nr:hypothetical protein RRG08_004207 [Elysia crispata]
MNLKRKNLVALGQCKDSPGQMGSDLVTRMRCLESNPDTYRHSGTWSLPELSPLLAVLAIVGENVTESH